MPSKRKQKIVKKMSLIIACIIFLISSTICITYFLSMADNQTTNKELQSLKKNNEIITEEQTNDNVLNNITTPEKEEEEENYTQLLSYVPPFLEANPDMVGWIEIPGIEDPELSYPVVQGDDNKFYLTHTFYKKKNEAGTIFADRMCVVNPIQKCDNIILYGHNQMDGSMFGKLTDYKKDPLFVMQAPVIKYNTNYKENQYVIFSVFLINTDSKDDDNKPLFLYHEYINFDETYDFDYWLSEVKKRSLINSNIETLESDKYITLSTCAVEFDSARLVIVGRKVRSEEQLNISYTKNENPYFPDIYYKKHGDRYQY